MKERLLFQNSSSGEDSDARETGEIIIDNLFLPWVFESYLTIDAEPSFIGRATNPRLEDEMQSGERSRRG